MHKYRFLIITLIVCVFVLSAAMGFLLIGNDEINTPAVVATPNPVTPVSGIAPEPEDTIFRIQLTGNILNLFEGGKIIRSTVISPDVYPYIDIESFERGASYNSYEDALMDWESLSE